MTEPPVWTPEELEIDRLKAIVIFRKQRMEEPLESYLEAFDRYRDHVVALLKLTRDLAELEAGAAEILGDPHLLEAFRYLAAPPISVDDFTTLAEAPSLARGRLRAKPQHVKRLIDVVRVVLDSRRFPWIPERRQATETERDSAIIASAALMAASRVQTNRRNLSKQQQEALVTTELRRAGLTEVGRREIPNVALAPAPGEFCAESSFGGRKADIIVRLWDHRVMPIECKVSNSSLNSVKRLNNDAAVKAVGWKRDFGLRQVVPTAVIAGVYKLHGLLDAQDRGLTLFWAHDLPALTNWIRKTKG